LVSTSGVGSVGSVIGAERPASSRAISRSA
jgi:hypothetical protein